MNSILDHSLQANSIEFGMNAFKEGWFTETGTLTGDQALSIEVDKVLYHEPSKFQDILVFQSKRFGRVLVLDNAIQCTEKDEFAYQEMITFLPLNCHPSPKKVLIIGGGDGGVARETVKHPLVESVTLCEIDEKVIEVSKKFLPFMSEGFGSPKLSLYIGDGSEFVKNHREQFDVIITDSSDPKGPAVCLFQRPYYESLKQALRPGGILCSQGESFWFDLVLMKNMVQMCKTIFPVVEYASSYVSTYPGGQIGYLLCSKSPDTNFREALPQYTTEKLDELHLKYYSREVHRGAFALPLFVSREMGLLQTEVDGEKQ